MKTVEPVATVHSQKQPENGQARRQSGIRKRIAQINGRTVAWYAFLTGAGVLLFKVGAYCAMQKRGYHAVGGEVLALLLPVLYYITKTIIGDIIKDRRERR